jgi:hypothetical protein
MSTKPKDVIAQMEIDFFTWKQKNPQAPADFINKKQVQIQSLKQLQHSQQMLYAENMLLHDRMALIKQPEKLVAENEFLKQQLAAQRLNDFETRVSNTPQLFKNLYLGFVLMMLPRMSAQAKRSLLQSGTLQREAQQYPDLNTLIELIEDQAEPLGVAA